jgi:hypothetical protein
MLFPQTQVSPRLVGISNNSETLLPDRLVIGWSIFVAAMTTNSGLQSELILRVYNATFVDLNTSWVFPVYYDSSDGTALQGIAR